MLYRDRGGRAGQQRQGSGRTRHPSWANGPAPGLLVIDTEEGRPGLWPRTGHLQHRSYLQAPFILALDPSFLFLSHPDCGSEESGRLLTVARSRRPVLIVLIYSTYLSTSGESVNVSYSLCRSGVLDTAITMAFSF